MPSDDFITLDDFCGSAAHSPSGEWTIAHGIPLDSNETEDRHYRLLRGERIVSNGKLSRRIDSASICDSGHFALSFEGDGDSNDTAVWFFRPDGKQYTSINAPGFLAFFTLLQDGKQLLFSYDSKVLLLDLSPVWQRVMFSLPSFFYPQDGSFTGDTVFLHDRSGGPYRFATDGTFVDRAEWLGRYSAIADGQTLFNLYRNLSGSYAGWTQEDFLNAAGWIEEALRRGIQDSFSLKRADVYSLLASLKTKGGDLSGADDARRLVEENEDGFRVVDQIATSIKQLIEANDQDAIKKAIFRLTRAEQYERRTRGQCA